MGLTHSAGIITDGLVLCLDAGNQRSYPGSGTILYNISRSNNTATLTNGPIFNSENNGSIVLDGVNDYILANNISLNSSFSTTSVSHFIWVYPISAGQIVVELGSTTINSGWHDSNIEINTNGSFSFSTWHNTLSNKVTSSNQSFNRWYYVGFTYNGTTLNAYINGVSVGTVNFSRSAPYNNGQQTHYALFANDATNMGTFGYGGGRFSNFTVYNRSLNLLEVQQNFNSLRGRFGI